MQHSRLIAAFVVVAGVVAITLLGDLLMMVVHWILLPPGGGHLRYKTFPMMPSLLVVVFADRRVVVLFFPFIRKDCSVLMHLKKELIH